VALLVADALAVPVWEGDAVRVADCDPVALLVPVWLPVLVAEPVALAVALDVAVAVALAEAATYTCTVPFTSRGLTLFEPGALTSCTAPLASTARRAPWSPFITTGQTAATAPTKPSDWDARLKL